MKEFSAETGAAAADQYCNMALSAIVPSLTNPRKTFNAEKLLELANSIQASGVHQPIVVRPLPGSRLHETFIKSGKPGKRPTHEIVTGERRYIASNQAGLATIPTLVCNLTDTQVLEIQIVENLQRADLTELEEAEGYQALMDHGMITAEDVGAKIGKSRSYVYARLKLLDLTTEGRTALREGTIDASRALLLARIHDPKLQIRALTEISHKDFTGDLSLSYREALGHIRHNYMLRLDAARFKITDTTLLAEAGSCRTCNKRTGHNPDLFADVDGADACTDPPCFHRKEEARTAQLLRCAFERGQTVIEGREAKALMPNEWSGIDGYLRLDDARDSPSKDPLRKLLGKQLDKDGVLPTLIANPYKDGELIAVLPGIKVAELLRAKGHTAAADKVTQDAAQDRKHEAAAAKAKLKTEYEQAWRNLLLERTWQAMEAANEGPTPWPDLDRFQALRYAMGYNNDKNKVACKLLGLGKVAPSSGLIDHIKDTPAPGRVLLLLIMLGDAEYRPWLGEESDANEGLMLVANRYQVDVAAVKAECKKATTAKVKPATRAPGNTNIILYRGPNGETWTGRGRKPRWVTAYVECGGNLDDLKEPPLPLASAAQAKGGGGGAKGKSPTAPGGAESGRKCKLSAPEAQAAIAAAMQDTDPGAADASQGLEQAATARPGAPTSVAGDDGLYQRAVTLIAKQNKVSVRLFKTDLGIGTARALELMDQLETTGKVSACDQRGTRKVLVAA